MKYDYRYIARIQMQAETPIVVGSGNKELTTDRPVAKDANGIPYIPGTSLAGVLRHALFANAIGNDALKNTLNHLLGFQDVAKQEDSRGSRVAISSAQLIGKNGTVFDGLFLLPDHSDENYELLNHFLNLPVRQHVNITHKGVANTKDKGKFDEEVLYKGSRFIFEIEMKGTSENKISDELLWTEMLKIFNHPDFRIGSGATKGFGKIKIININHLILNLCDLDQRGKYLNHSSELNKKFKGEDPKLPDAEKTKYTSYKLELKPEDFYLFSSGKKSDDADMNPVMDEILTWDDPQNPVFSEEMVLIPASSVKGTISHRVVYNFWVLHNKNKPENERIFADRLPEGKTIENFVGENNPAVKVLFGEASNYAEDKPGQRGNVLFSDVYLTVDKEKDFKKLDHVAIDRLTDGAIDGALFNESVVNDKINPFNLEFWVNPEFSKTLKMEEKAVVMNAFENTLIDICNGSLPLGGGTMRGNGVFKGKLTKTDNGKEEVLYTYQ